MSVYVYVYEEMKKISGRSRAKDHDEKMYNFELLVFTDIYVHCAWCILYIYVFHSKTDKTVSFSFIFFLVCPFD